MSGVTNVSDTVPGAGVTRRGFLGTAGAFVLAATVPGLARGSAPADHPGLPGIEQRGAFAPNLWLAIDPDGTVLVTSHRSEMGQGIRTAIAQIVADELEADWDRVKVLQAPGDKAYGDQNTDGSRSILMFFDTLRESGASARAMLESAAADAWGVPVAEVSAANHVVRHARSGKTLGFGELAGPAASRPVPEHVAFKSRGDYKYIGKAKRHVDVDDIISGNGTYGADVVLPGMATAVIVRGPVLGAAVKSVKAPRKQPGYLGHEVLDAPKGAPVFAPLGGVAVLAEDTHLARTIADSLEIEWTESPNDRFDSNRHQAELRRAVQAPQPSMFETGNVTAAFEEGGTALEAVYETPFLSHAPMEPPCAVARVSADKCEVWAPVQDPQSTRGLVAGYLQMPPEQVTINVTLLGGAFGRKSKPDFVLEAVELAKRSMRPVRVVWSREDDIHHDYFHAASAQYHKATLSESGLPDAWLQRTAFPSITTVFSDDAEAPAPWELEMGFSNLPYRVANQRFESKGIRPGVRVGWMRSVCNIFHAFGANVFVDEMAAAAGIDPIDYRVQLMGDTSQPFEVPGMQAPAGHAMDRARLERVMREVRDLSDWDKPRAKGRGLGFAVHHSFRSYVATVLEVSVEGGQVNVHDAFVALDCGTYINPDTCKGQMEGAVVFGLSLALHGQITMANGSVQQSNFHDYPVLRMNECPNVAVRLIDSEELPAGVGEPGVPPVAPALVNAIFAASGERHRTLPLSA